MKRNLKFNHNWLRLLFSLTLILSVATACEDDDGDTLPAQEDSIITIAATTEQFSILAAAIEEYPDLVATLGGEGTFTVFAPTNTAFEAAGITEDNVDEVRN